MDMDLSREQTRLLILHEFRLGRNGSEAARNICQSMGEGTVSITTVTSWFKKFRDENYELMDQPHMGREVTVDVEVLRKKVEDDPSISSVELGEYFHCHHTTICRHLHKLGKTWNCGKWISHELAEDMQQRVDDCMYNLVTNKNDAWLTDLVTGDGAWKFCVNHTRKRKWLDHDNPDTPSQDGKKIALSVWWGINGVIHWELLDPNTTTKELYCKQLEKLNQKLKGKQDNVYFLHDNSKEHLSKVIRHQILDFGWVMIPHPPRSPDLSPSEYHLFKSLKTYLSKKQYDSQDHLEADIDQFFSSKSPEFYRDGIMDLPRRWQKVIDADGMYVD